MPGLLTVLILLGFPVTPAAATPVAGQHDHHLLYVAEPGIRNYVQHGGIGVLVFDVVNGHKFVRRMPTWPSSPGKEPEAIKGICACAKTGRLYVSTTARMLCMELATGKILWDRTYEGGC